jgi:hypothetical protein
MLHKPFNSLLTRYILQGLPFSYAYLDDLFIASPSPEKHKQHLFTVLTCLQDHESVIHPAKSVLRAKHLDFLIHYVDLTGIHASI